MSRFRGPSTKRLHATLGDGAMAWRRLAPEGPVAAYLHGFGVTHLLAAGREADAAALVVDFEGQLARRRARTDEADIGRWIDDCGAVARQTRRRDVACWADFARTRRHLFRTRGWEPWRVLFQAARGRRPRCALGPGPARRHRHLATRTSPTGTSATLCDATNSHQAAPSALFELGP